MTSSSIFARASSKRREGASPVIGLLVAGGAQHLDNERTP